MGNNKFIFVGNTKCASGSIEKSRLGEISEIKLTSSYIGKHMSIEGIYERFGFLFKEYNFEDFFKFGIIRDPLHWVVSWFNYRARPELADPTHRNHENYTGLMQLADFWNLNKNRRFLTPQSARFFSKTNQKIKVDYLVRFEKLTEDLSVVKKILGLHSLKIMHKNKSIVRRIGTDEVDDVIRKEIIQKYRSDYDLIRKLDSYNSNGLERFRMRASSVSRSHDGVMNLLKDFIIGTPFETPTRSLINFIKTRKKI